ncbi:MAG: hypothetical protein J6Z01_02470, partial [Bacteroidales bacterium]|nr:hypothetical protein [Bacteroidales bacterium]
MRISQAVFFCEAAIIQKKFTQNPYGINQKVLSLQRKKCKRQKQTMSTNCIGTSFEKHIGIVFCLGRRQKDALVF